MKLIVNGKWPALRYSEEVNKRIGLFLITNAETTIGEEAFEKLAYNSYKVNDKLGYFVDLSIMKEALIENNINSKKIMSLGSNIAKPDWYYYFHSESFISIANEYGTLHSLGMNFEYNNTFTGEKTPPNLSAASGSVDELKYNMKDMFNIHNEKVASTGRFDFEKKNYKRELKINQGTISTDNFGAKVGLISMAANYTEGAMQGFKVAKIELPMWRVGGNNFFSVIKSGLTKYINRDGEITAQLLPHFYSLPEMLVDRSIRNYADYLEMPDGFHKKFLCWLNNSFKGWNY